MSENFPDKFHLTRDLNVRYARSNFTRLVHTNARFEGVNTTLPQTQTIMDGMGVDGVSLDDINVIVDLKRGWEYVTKDSGAYSLNVAKEINRLVAAHDALIPGELRTGTGGVALSSDETFEPPLVNETEEDKFISQVMGSSTSATDKALTILYHNMRSQIFWDGNKRTATLSANKIMIDSGAGLINVPLDKWGHWNTLISEFYKSNDMTKIKKWTYENAMQGPQLHIDRKPTIQKKHGRER